LWTRRLNTYAGWRIRRTPTHSSETNTLLRPSHVRTRFIFNNSLCSAYGNRLAHTHTSGNFCDKYSYSQAQSVLPPMNMMANQQSSRIWSCAALYRGRNESVLEQTPNTSQTRINLLKPNSGQIQRSGR